MALREIVLYPDKPLKQKAEPVKKVGPQIARLAADMLETMDENDGVGLAAPQIGIARRIVVLRNPETEQTVCLVNPEISNGEGEEYGEEGCLSLSQVFAMVPRYTKILVRALDEHGKQLEFEATGMFARIIQHETDHLDGLIFLDRVDVLTREAKLREWEEIRSQMASRAINQ
jgi:peptide deformylase